MADAVPSNRTDHFAASYDLTTKINSAVMVVFPLIVAAVVHSIFICCLLLLSVFFVFAYSPRAYVVSDRAIEVDSIEDDFVQPGRCRRLPRSDLGFDAPTKNRASLKRRVMYEAPAYPQKTHRSSVIVR
jgi:hypothetical protein